MLSDRLLELLSQFSAKRIAVIGDFFLDKYLEVDHALDEPSVETGLNANQVVAIRRFAGAAGTVVNNLSALGCKTLLAFGAVGDDGEAFDLRRCLQSVGCDTDGLATCGEIMTPTYLKPRDRDDPTLAGEHERYDTKNRSPIPVEVLNQVLALLDRSLAAVDAVIVLDQVVEENCGVITAAMRTALSDRARKHPHVLFWADSRKHVREFQNMIIKANQFEAVGHANPRPGELIDLNRMKLELPRLRAMTQAAVCVTLGERGLMVSDPVPTFVPAVRVDGPIDPTGAGDSVTAGMVLSLLSGATMPEAALVGNLVASLTVQQLATTGVARPEELPPRLEIWRQQHA
jgi:bifunctional ADP-heptose synthase (sugar kinase/adenylyltransferase)